MIGKMEDKTAGVAIEEFVWLKPEVYSKVLNKNVVEKLTHSEYRYVLLDKKCLFQWIEFKEKNHRIRTYEIKKTICLTLMIYTS